MQTFLPYKHFRKAAAVLDNKRLGKQRVETKQILLALGVAVGPHAPAPLSRWRNHPAVKMWRGHEQLLAYYGLDVCVEWRSRCFRDTLAEQFSAVISALDGPFVRPDWLDDERLLASHRSNLLRKDPVFYGKYGWTEPPDLPYFWPTQEQIPA